MELPTLRKTFHPGFCQALPGVFHSLEEARNSLDYQWNNCQRKATDFEYRERVMLGTETPDHREAWDAQREHFKAVIRSWMNAFQKFIDSHSTRMDSRALLGAKVLKMNAVVATMHLELNAFSIIHQQTCWDDLMPIFEDLVDLATGVVEGQQVLDHGRNDKPLFQLDFGVVPSLFTVAHKCRDPYLRRRAINLLYSAPRQEGVWDGVITARVGERIMMLEEKGLGEITCAADVPDQSRVSDVNVSFDLLARRGFIKYSRLRSLDSEIRAPITDVLEW